MGEEIPLTDDAALAELDAVEMSEIMALACQLGAETAAFVASAEAAGLGHAEALVLAGDYLRARMDDSEDL